MQERRVERAVRRELTDSVKKLEHRFRRVLLVAVIVGHGIVIRGHDPRVRSGVI